MNFQDFFRKKDIRQVIREQAEGGGDGHSLHKNLSLVDLTAMGIAAVIGAGIFSTIGNASASGGPAVAFLFIFTAIACGFSALCYAQFAATVPVSGSAYTYTYTTFGELLAWIVGWNLLIEYAIGNIAVAISWSDYLTGLLSGFGWDIPPYLTMDYLSASRAFESVTTALASGKTLDDITKAQQLAYQAWVQAPQMGSLRLIADVPALTITVLITYLVYVGIKESKTASNLMVLFKLIIILAVIAVGAFYIKPENWSPFAPNGVGGILKGVSAVFFAYIGFDAVSTTAEECKNPQRDLPRAMFLTLVICTVLYILIALVLTGMVNYKELAVGDPLAYAFDYIGLDFISGVVAVSAVVAIASVLLVFQLGQPRIWMSMSRDGLLPAKFSEIHPKYKTPWFATIITGVVVAVPALFMNLTEVTDLTSIGTLFAFAVVCGGILVIESKHKDLPARFKVPYFNSRFWLPPVIVLVGTAVYINDPVAVKAFFSYTDWATFADKIPVWIFLVVAVYTTFLSIQKQLSLVPVLGLLCNLYLMSELGLTNWLRFGAWLLLGVVIYLAYGVRHSKLRKA
jgi:amino acid transporter